MASSRKPQKSTERENPLTSAGVRPKEKEERSEPGQSPQVQAEARSEPEQETSGADLQPRRRKPEEEQATEKVTAYFTIAQYDKIEELRNQYRKRAKKRINVNALLRRLVERATIEDILP